MKEKYDKNINLEGLNAATMDLITGYIYTARVEITKDNAVALLSASDYLQIDGKSTLRVVILFSVQRRFASPCTNNYRIELIFPLSVIVICCMMCISRR